jgi:photosystem II stability/assembly factor-like uncharacterized protein
MFHRRVHLTLGTVLLALLAITFLAVPLASNTVEAMRQPPERSEAVRLPNPAHRLRGQQNIASQKTTEVTVRDIGPEMGVSFAGAGFVINRNDPRQLLVSSPAGIFKSYDGGHSWRRVFEGGVFFLRQDPGNPLAVFATDENTQFLIRSSDFFESWSFKTQGCPTCNVDVAIHQASSQTVLLLARYTAIDQDDPESKLGVLLRSNDGGQTFVVQGDDGLPMGCTFTNIETTAADPNIVYVVMNDNPFGNPPGIFKSTDAGYTFSRLEESPPRPLQVFTHPTDANVLFVQDSAALRTTPGIYRSLDGGASFEPVTGGLTNTNYFVAFDPHNPSYVYVAGQGGFFRSTDGGTTFQSTGLTREQLGLAATTATIDPANPSVIYVNTNRGNFKSVNGGVTFTSISKGWTAVRPNDISFDNADNPTLYVAGQYGAGILKTQTRGNQYDEVMNPLALSLLSGSAWPSLITVAPSDPARIVVATSSRGVFVTHDRGQTWTQSSVDTGHRRFREILIDTKNPNNIYMLAGCQFENCFLSQGGSEFYRSTDGGLTFAGTQVWPDAPSSIRTLAMDPSNPQVIYLGGSISTDCVEVELEEGIGFECTEVGALLKSSDGGLTFAAIEYGEFSALYDVTVDPNNSNTVYLSGWFPSDDLVLVGANLVRSSDGGATFVAVDAGLELNGYKPSLEELVIDPHDPKRLFALTDAGLFMSKDGAASWTRLNIESIDAVFGVHSLTMNPKKPNLLYVTGATVFELEIK